MGVYKKQPKKISRLIISDIEKLMFYYRQKYITVFYGFIRCNKVSFLYKTENNILLIQLRCPIFFIDRHRRIIQAVPELA